MAYGNMIQELLGIPGCNRGLVATKINEAFQAIQNENTWNWQLITGGWLTPGLLGGNGQTGDASTTFLSPGTITVNPFTNIITGDAIATAAWLSITSPPLITQYQFRIPYYSLYSAIALGNNGTVAYLTITSPGSGQTPGTYLVPGIAIPTTPGSGAIASITVNGDGTVTLPPIITNPGSGYQMPDGTANLPIFTLAEGGVSATFTATLIATITIDRPWMEPAQLNAGYMAYQAYFPAPAGFKRWFNIRDTTNNNYVDWWTKDQRDLSDNDAERTIFDEPLYAVPYGPDIRQGSATFGQMLYELWPHPITELPYTFQCMANAAPLVNNADTLPYPLTEEIVKLRAYEMLALWKESQKGDEMERGSGANWQFLTVAYRKEYDDRLREIRIMDRHLSDLYFTRMQRLPGATNQDGFATQTGQLNVGY